MGIPIIFDKPFKTYDEQIAHLRDNYGLDIVDEELAKYILSTFSYYDIINGYQECMMQNGKFNLTGKKSPTSIGGAMNCPIVFCKIFE